MKRTMMLGVVIAGMVLGFGLMAGAAQEVCPEAGKVESQVDGDLDDIVLPAGTLVCIKGSTDLVNVVADGESTLAELLGNGHNVSHYTVLGTSTTTTLAEETTTTLIDETTTTQSDEEPTTTLADETTTTVGDTTTTVGDETTTTQETTTTAEATTTTAPAVDPADELPFTGISATLLWGIGVTLLSTGMFLVRRFQGR